MPTSGHSQGAYTTLTILKLNNHFTPLDLQGCAIALFPRNTQYRHCHTIHRPHRRTSRHSRYRQRVPSGNQGGLAIGKKTLNRYYDKTDHSTMTWVITGMLSSVH